MIPNAALLKSIDCVGYDMSLLMVGVGAENEKRVAVQVARVKRALDTLHDAFLAAHHTKE